MCILAYSLITAIVTLFPCSMRNLWWHWKCFALLCFVLLSCVNLNVDNEIWHGMWRKNLAPREREEQKEEEVDKNKWEKIEEMWAFCVHVSLSFDMEWNVHCTGVKWTHLKIQGLHPRSLFLSLCYPARYFQIQITFVCHDKTVIYIAAIIAAPSYNIHAKHFQLCWNWQYAFYWTRVHVRVHVLYEMKFRLQQQAANSMHIGKWTLMNWKLIGNIYRNSFIQTNIYTKQLRIAYFNDYNVLFYYAFYNLQCRVNLSIAANARLVFTVDSVSKYILFFLPIVFFVSIDRSIRTNSIVCTFYVHL